MTLNIPVLVGTTRPGNKSQHVGTFLKEIIDSYDGVETTVVSPDLYDMPGDGNDEELKDPKYTKLTAEADAFIIVIPEYNRSYPGSLKRMIDSELQNYMHKPVALVGVSAGSFGGARAVEHIIAPLREMGMVVTFAEMFVTDSYNRFDEKGAMVNDVERYTKNAHAMLDELTWMAKTLKDGIKNHPNKYHEDK